MTATKFQVTLPLGLADELKLAAEQLGIPLAEWIRSTMQSELRRLRSSNSGPAPAAHWLDEMVVLEHEPDVSSRIDDILYGE